MKWFNKKAGKLPEYWQQYAASFQTKPEKYVKDCRFVVLDTETTGFDLKEDRMLCIGAVEVIDNTILVANSFERYIHQEHFNPNTVAIHGILKKGKMEKFSEEEVLIQFLNYVKNAVIVAHHAGFDLGMINMALKRNGLPTLKNKVIDTGNLYRRTRLTTALIDQHKHFSLDDIAEVLNISKKDRHTAAGDAYITAIALLKLINRLADGKEMKVKTLARA